MRDTAINVQKEIAVAKQLSRIVLRQLESGHRRYQSFPLFGRINRRNLPVDLLLQQRTNSHLARHGAAKICAPKPNQLQSKSRETGCLRKGVPFTQSPQRIFIFITKRINEKYYLQKRQRSPYWRSKKISGNNFYSRTRRVK